MSLQDRIEALKEKHAALERAIDEENRRPLPNRDAVSDLKRQKLRIKDEIYQLQSHSPQIERPGF